jgi:uncharacterized integral membrane protein (TIGR00697 family)
MLFEKVIFSDEKIVENNDYKLLGVFNSILIVSLLLCDVFIFKTVDIFGLSLALSGVIFPLTSLIMICINEIYGHKDAAKSLVNLIIAQLFFLTGLLLLPQLPSPPGYAPEIVQAYHIVFHSVWRVFLSSPFGIAITLYLSSIINSKLKTHFLGKYLFIRVFINAVITTAILVSIIYPINFYGILAWDKIFKICISTYFYKIIMAVIVLFISMPIIALGKRIEKKYIFDFNVSFNPLNIYTKKSSGINLYEQAYK